MPEADRLADLPLLLAGLPRNVRDVLRTAGIPVRTLPASSIATAVSERFVLFDSRIQRSGQQARSAVRAGLKIIDVAECGLPDDDGPLSGSQATQFLAAVKTRLEELRGLWVRVCDYPFPFESALCLSAEHGIERLPDLARFEELLPQAATHFVSTRLRGDWLTYVAMIGAGEIGWMVEPEDLLDAPRKTRSHWATRRQRFEDSGLNVRGLYLTSRDLLLPGLSSLGNLGFSYAAHECAAQGGNVRCEADWISLGSVSLDGLAAVEAGPSRFAGANREEASTLAVPPHYAGESVESSDVPYIVRSLQSLHRGGRPVFVHGSGEPECVARFLLLRGEASRLSLMWQTTLGEFARWWALRPQVEFRAWQAEGGCDVEAQGDLAAVPRSIEIWRGQHRAVLPLNQPSLAVRDEGIAYVHTPDRSPAGLAALPDRSKLAQPSPSAPVTAHDSWAA